MYSTQLTSTYIPKKIIWITHCNNMVWNFFLQKKLDGIGVMFLDGHEHKGMCVPSMAPTIFGNPVKSLNCSIILHNLSPCRVWIYLSNNPSRLARILQTIIVYFCIVDSPQPCILFINLQDIQWANPYTTNFTCFLTGIWCLTNLKAGEDNNGANSYTKWLKTMKDILYASIYFLFNIAGVVCYTLPSTTS